jgi:hypothetical protein
MAEPHSPTSHTDAEVAIDTVPLPGEAKVLIWAIRESRGRRSREFAITERGSTPLFVLLVGLVGEFKHSVVNPAVGLVVIEGQGSDGWDRAGRAAFGRVQREELVWAPEARVPEAARG